MSRLTETLVEFKELEKVFVMGKGYAVKAVAGVSFSIAKGEVFGLIGESGSGKSTIGKCLAGIEYSAEGTILYGGMDISKTKSEKKEKKETRRKIQMIFQDPLVSMNPRMNIQKIIEEPMKLFKLKLSETERKERIQELLKQVGIQENIMERYPSELSGGQNQRVCIARALACEPEVIVADEPTASLDVFVRGQIIALLQSLQREKGMTILLITHDLILARGICNKIGIINDGKLVETGETEDVCQNPRHLYTRSLLSAIPDTNPRNRKKDTSSVLR